MPTVYLPTAHSEADLALAGQIAEALECTALYVTWSPRGYEGPDCEAVLVSATPSVDEATGPASSPARDRFMGALRRIVDSVAAWANPPRYRRRADDPR